CPVMVSKHFWLSALRLGGIWPKRFCLRLPRLTGFSCLCGGVMCQLLRLGLLWALRAVLSRPSSLLLRRPPLPGAHHGPTPRHDYFMFGAARVCDPSVASATPDTCRPRLHGTANPHSQGHRYFALRPVPPPRASAALFDAGRTRTTAHFDLPGF
ncbi:unnamed protein product, partial [Pleuronectes platessa]